MRGFVQDVDKGGGRVVSRSMANVLNEEKRQQILALGRLGWSVRRIQQATRVRRVTISSYLKAAAIVVWRPGGWSRQAPAKATMQVITDSAKAAIQVITGFGVELRSSEAPPPLAPVVPVRLSKREPVEVKPVCQDA